MVKIAGRGPERICYNRAAMQERQGHPKRIFAYDEALALLPEVRRLTEEAYERAQLVGATLSAGGAIGADAQDKLSVIVQQWAEALTREGLEVKGLWLVDFDNGSGYYCWRYPEEGLHYYHSYEEGFGGRMRIQ